MLKLCARTWSRDDLPDQPAPKGEQAFFKLLLFLSTRSHHS